MRSKTIVSTLMIALLTAPLMAYSIYLKDGSRLIAKEQFRIEDGRAIITLQNGTQTFIDVSEIDIPRTEAANQGQYGTAFVIEDGKLVETPVTKTEEKPSLTDLSRRSGARASTRPTATRAADGSTSGDSDLPLTAAGAVDLTVVPRAPFRNLEIAAEASRFLRALGVNESQVYQGTESGRAFLEITANSESSVFRGLEAAADTLLHLRNQFSGEVDALVGAILAGLVETAHFFV